MLGQDLPCDLRWVGAGEIPRLLQVGALLAGAESLVHAAAKNRPAASMSQPARGAISKDMRVPRCGHLNYQPDTSRPTRWLYFADSLYTLMLRSVRFT